MMSIQSVVIIGSGNVATHLGLLLKQAGLTIDVVYSRDQRSAEVLASRLGAIPYTQLNLLPTHADLYLIAVKDTAIEDVSNQLPLVAGMVVHTSGTTPITVLHKHNRAGVFYPLQSLSKTALDTLPEIPLLIESVKETDNSLLENLAKQCGSQTLLVNSEDRRVVHMAAVFANNFSNHLYVIAEQILSTKNISINMLKPLIMETAQKVQTHTPSEVQTGPAIRNDWVTMDMHLQLMAQMPQFKQVYELMSKSIQDTQSVIR